MKSIQPAVSYRGTADLVLRPSRSPFIFLPELIITFFSLCTDSTMTLLTTPPGEVCRLLAITEDEARDLLTWAARRHYSRSNMVSVLELLKIQDNLLSFGDGNIDDFFGGGLPTHVITDVSGAGGSGKVQLCMQLCVMATLDRSCGGFDSPVIVIATGRVFEVARLKVICEHVYGRYGRSGHEKALNKISIVHVSDADTLEHIIHYQIPEAVRRMGCRLVLISSITSVFRYHDEEEAYNRTESLLSICRSLKRVAYENGAVVVCVNQANSLIAAHSGSTDTTMERICSSGVSIDPGSLLKTSELSRNFLSSQGDVPSLGLLWESLSTVRVLCILKKSSAGDAPIRLLSIVSPYHDHRRKLPFQITQEGVVGLQVG